MHADTEVSPHQIGATLNILYQKEEMILAHQVLQTVCENTLENWKM